MDLDAFAGATSIDTIPLVVDRLVLLAYFQQKANQATAFSLGDALSWFAAVGLPCPNATRLKNAMRRSRAFRRLDGKKYALRRAEIDRLDIDLRHLNLSHPDRILRTGCSNFIATERIDGLRQARHTNFDFGRLIQICQELNNAYGNSSVISIAALTRALLDHVPPIFGFRTFSEVASNHRGGHSLKSLLMRLEETSRKISDRQLHGHIARKVDVPTMRQVDFSNELDVLLGEVIRVVASAA